MILMDDLGTYTLFTNIISDFQQVKFMQTIVFIDFH